MAVKSKVKKTPRERYLAIPYHILNLRDIGLCQKVLLAHIYSFRQKGCWQSNKTLAEIFMVSAKTISRWIFTIHKHIYIRNPKGYYRTMWAKTHSEVRFHLDKSVKDVRQNCGSELDKSGISLPQKCPTTNNNTNKETNRATIAPPAPLPAGGQAPAALTDRKKQTLTEIEQFKSSFGIGKRPTRIRMTEQEFQQKKERMRKALLAGREL